MPFFRAPVLENRRVGTGYHHLVLEGGDQLGRWLPGQFVMLRGWGGWDPMLPRAFSLYGGGPGARLEILLKVVGPGTARLGALPEGAEVAVHGPLGRPFEPVASAELHLLVAGGIGIVPMLPLAHRLAADSRPRLLYGGRSAGDHAGAEDFASVAEVQLASDDGSVGHHGFVTELLNRALGEGRRPAVYACGPEPMLARVAAICREASVPGQLCLEAPMACGYGACLGCVVETTRGFKRVCREGPVFSAEEVYR